MGIHLIYITTKNKEEAQTIGQALVTERLAACVNIIDPIHSIYWWEGKVCEDDESILIAKTKESLVSLLIEKVKSLHSYDCPCIVSVPIDGGNSAFIEWVERVMRNE